MRYGYLQLLNFKLSRQSMESRYLITQRKSKHLFRGQERATGKEVIIKKVSFSAVSAKEKERIVNEVNTLLKMDYVHILRYYDFDINKKDVTVDIAMEFCQGGTLQDLITKYRSEGRRIKEEQIWKIFYQLTQAIDYIQKCQTIHRNIDPSNIYFKQSQRQQIKLGGFNQAKKFNSSEMFATSVLPNTHYLSPEQLETGIFTVQTDIWELGCLMYEVCMLQSPFKHVNQFQRAKMIKDLKPKRIKQYSLELNRIIFWCLEKNPEDRPKISDLLGAPEINMRIRERRYQQKQVELLAKQQALNRKEEELTQKQKEYLSSKKMARRYDTLKKSGEVLSNRNLTYLKSSC